MCVCVCVCVEISGYSYKILDEIIYFLQSDVTATFFSPLAFVWLLFEDSYYSRVAFVCLESPQTSMTAG